MAESPFLSEVLAQPGILLGTIGSLANRPDRDALRHLAATARTGRVVLTGMGASLCALYPLLYELFAAGIGAILLETGELLHYGRALLTGNTVLVVVSQSGRSAETVRLLESCPSDVTVVGVTNDPQSPLAERATHVLELGAGREGSVSSKTYVASIAALQWLAAVLTSAALDDVATDLVEASEGQVAYLNDSRAHLDVLRAELTGVDRVYCVGRGPSLAATMMAGLIVKEATGLPAEGMASASFRHGPIEVVAPGVLVLIYEGSAERFVSLAHGLAADIEAAHGQARLCGTAQSSGPFRLPAVSPRALPLLEILPIQLMAIALAELRGLQFGQFRVATKVTERE
jgi:glutamine---fructose-6-phosphate transaminase (isomerizing)